jgi:tetratricopeptide (TPR) repeat protein
LAMLGWAAGNAPGFSLDPHEAGVTYERLGAYRSAAVYLLRAAASAKERGEWDVEAGHLGGAGFALRQAGRARESVACYALARTVLAAATAAGSSPSFATLDNVLRGGFSTWLDLRPSTDQLVALERDLERLVAHPDCDALRRALLALSFAELRVAQGRRAAALAYVKDGASQCEALQHFEGWAKAARILSTLDRRAGRAMLRTVNERITTLGQARRDLAKNRLATALAVLPLPTSLRRDPTRNSLLRKLRCRRAERRARAIERQFGWHGPGDADTTTWNTQHP